MSIFDILCFWLIILINTAFGGNYLNSSYNFQGLTCFFLISAEKLIVQELNQQFTSATVQWSNTVTLCTATDFTEFSNQSVMGIYAMGQVSGKYFQNIPPHWSLSVRLDLVLYLTLDPNDQIQVQLNNIYEGYTKDAYFNGNKLCFSTNTFGDELVLFYRNITHSDPSITINVVAYTDQPVSDEGTAFKNFSIYVDTCHDSCLTCNGPTANQCLTCPPNSTQNGNTCTCNSGYKAQNNSCILTCSVGFTQDSTGKLCVQDFCYNVQCQTCLNGLCTQCKTGFYLLNGQCVTQCPSYSTQSGQNCVDSVSQASYRSYLLKSMFSTNFGESEIIGAGISVFGFLGFNTVSSRALTTVCNGYSLLGGAYLSSYNSYIQTQFTALQPHSQVIIGYTLYKIDSWNNESVQLIVDGNIIVTTTKNISDGSSNLCGRVSVNDQIIQVQQLFSHTNPSLTMQIKSNLKSDPFTESYGIRELFVLIDYCSPNCIKCNASACTQCQTNFYLYNSQCTTACPSNMAPDQNQICQLCDSSCNTCLLPQSSTSCSSCKPNSYLNPNKSCQSTCPSQYWTNNSNWQCQACDQTCYNCQSPGDSNSCISCSGYLFLSSNKCVDTCPSNTFPSYQINNNICKPCNASCNTCDGPSNNNCLSCLAPSSFYQQSSKTCGSTCNSNQYKNTTNQTCSSCHQFCTTCSGPSSSNCLSCSGNTFLYQGQCITNCPVKFFNNATNNSCTPCDITCYTCTNVNPNNCLSCQLPNYFDPTSNKCLTTCNSSYYADSSSVSCKQCHSSCLTCSGPLQSNCLSCNTGLFLQNNQCKLSCDISYYVQNLTNICLPCNSSCKTCDGPNNNNCLSCQAPNFYQQSLKTCVNQCNSNQFQDTVNQICSPCDSSCSTCQGLSNFNCLSCTGNTFLYSNQCVSNCPLRYFNNIANSQCNACDSTCFTCDGNAPNNCLSCQLPKYLDPITKQCILNCNSNYYPDVSSVQCKLCNSSCLKCNGPLISNCVACASGLYLQNSYCKQICDGSFFGDSQTNTCQLCHPSCKTCDGPNSNNCLSCQAPLLYYKQITKTCESQCSLNQFNNSANQICTSCYPLCSTCQGPSSSNCLSCSGNTFLFQSQCIANCPINYFNNSQTNQCSPCDPTCYTCSGSSSNQCLSCQLQRYLDPTSKQCVLTCNPNQYPDVNLVQCQQCNVSCLTCNGPLLQNCTSCRTGQYLQNNQCKQSCDGSFYGNTTTNTCQACDLSCKTCDGPNINNCLSCQAPNFYQQSSKTCETQCNQNQFQDTLNQKCSSCDSSCKTCSGPSINNCLSCSGNSYLYQNQCITNCPLQYFNNSQNNQCTQCHFTCQTCSGSSLNNCLTCQLPRYFDPITNKCVLSCNSNQYPDNNLIQCKLCDSSCLTCNGSSAYNCTSCVLGIFLLNNQCLQSCIGSYFKDIQTNTCKPCDQSCKTCDGPNSNNCLSCSTPLFYQQNTKTCISQCNLNQFQDTDNQVCSSCHPSCDLCSGPNDTNCLSCSGNLFQYQNQCVLRCPIKYFGNIQNNQCTLCDPTCLTCNGSAPNNCLSCQLDRLFDPTSNKCVQICQLNQYLDLDSESCKQCDPSCLTCYGPSALNCKSCKSGEFLQNDQCKQNCDDYYFVMPQSNKCQQCHFSCEKCSGPSQAECLSCAPNNFFLNNNCYQDCPENYYAHQQDQKCNQCHNHCKQGCNGPLQEDCSSIKYQYQVILYILISKTFIWIVSSIVGYIQDKKQSKVLNQINNSPNTIDSDKASKEIRDNSQIQFGKTDFQQSPNRTKLLQTFSQELQEEQQQPNITQVDQIQTNLNLNKNNIQKRRPRKLTHKNTIYLQSINSQIHLQSSLPQMLKSTNQVSPTVSSLINKDQKNQESLDDQIKQQKDEKYKDDKKFKFTILGNEWVSLFYFYDTVDTRVSRATLIFLKYSVFFLTTEFIYQNQYSYLFLSVALLLSLILKQFFKVLQSYLARKHFRLISVILLLFIAISTIEAYFWFVPELQSLKYLKDQTWSLYYGIVFLSDFVIVQQILSFFEYFFTVKYLNAMENKKRFVNFYKFLLNEHFIAKLK